MSASDSTLSGRPDIRRTRPLHYILVLSGAVIVVFVAARIAEIAKLQVAFFDDAYYYVILAQHFHEYGFFSFDGIYPTNGFHPLWGWILTALAGLFDGGLDQSQWIAVLAGLQTALVAATAILLAVLAAFALRRGREGDLTMAFGVTGLIFFLLCPAVSWRYLGGMESALVALLLTVTLMALWRGWLGLLAISMALLVLSRLDTLFFVVVPILVYLLATRHLSLRRMVAIALPTMLLTGGYLAANHIQFGHLKPISGALKSSFPVPNFQPSVFLDPVARLRELGGTVDIMKFFLDANLTALTGFVILLAAVLSLMRGERSDRTFDLFLLVVSFFLLMNFSLFQKWLKPIPPWYHAVAAIPVMLLLFRVLWQAAVALSGAQRALSWGLGLLLGAAGLWNGEHLFGALAAERRDAGNAFVDCILENTDATDLLAGTDIGTLSFQSGRNAVNLDGLVNTFAYQDRLAAGEFASYLRDVGADVLVVTVWDGPQDHWLRGTEPMYLARIAPDVVSGTSYETYNYYVYSYLHNVFSDRLTLTPGQEICRSERSKEGTADVVAIAFRLEN